MTADVQTIVENLALARLNIGNACVRVGREPSSVRICVATKYVEPHAMTALAAAGIDVVGENRINDLVAKQDLHGDSFEWHFIGQLQSRKVKEVAPRVSMIHSLASESALEQIALLQNPPALLVQVNVSGETSKAGIPPDQLDDFIARCVHPVSGLMTMPPQTTDPEDARRYFRELANMAASRNLAELSMGTSQDYVVAVEEGATIVRLGSILFREPSKNPNSLEN